MDTELELHVESALALDEGALGYLVSLRSINPKESDFTAQNVHLYVQAPGPPSKAQDHEASHGRERRLVTAALEGVEPIQQITQRQIWAFAYALFTLWPDQEYIAIFPAASIAWQSWLQPLLRSGLAIPRLDFTYPIVRERYEKAIFLSREEFWKGTGPLVAGGWVPVLNEVPCDSTKSLEKTFEDTLSLAESHSMCEMHQILSLGRNDPLYQRYIPELGKTLTFRKLDPHSDDDIAFCETFVFHGYHTLSMYDDEGNLDEDRKDFACAWDGQLFGIVDIDSNSESTGHSNEFGSGSDISLYLSNKSSISDYERLLWIRSVIHVCARSLLTLVYVPVPTACSIFGYYGRLT